MKNKKLNALPRVCMVYMDAMNPANILLFTNAPVGGLAANDANNKTREHMVLKLLNRDPAIPFSDPNHGPAWRSLADSLYETIDGRFGANTSSQMKAVLKAGRRFNWDYDLILPGATKKLELKVGHGTRVDSLPEFFNPAANYDFHGGASYAGYFYDNYLPRLLDIYPAQGLQMPTREWYIQKVHGTSRTPALFNHLHNAEVSGTDEQKREKKALVDQSITGWLNQTLGSTDIPRLTEAFLRSQGDKTFLLYDRATNKFHTDSIRQEELTVQSVTGIRNGNVLVLQSAVLTTAFHMLLRWKNHAGILYPAWQISMRR